MSSQGDDRSSLRVIGVGSSAGGLEALSKLLGAARSDLPWCFVVAQHLAPTQTSKLVDLLSRSTDLTVVAATDGATVQPGVVYVALPGTDVTVDDDVVRLPAADDDKRPWPSIDHLLGSLAASYGARAVGVVLSGTGDDGAAGVEALRAAGSVVAVQDPSTAAFGDMPGAAFATGAVDVSVAAETIAEELERLLFGPDRVSDPAPGTDDAHPTLELTAPADLVGSAESQLSDLDSIVVSLLKATGIDFSGYKRSTLQRQVLRRRRITNTAPDEYPALLARSTTEAVSLGRAVLVSVTAFFRDGPVWDAVAVHLRAVVDALQPGETLRLWVPGCASGEEAYTLAMVAAEALTRAGVGDLPAYLKIFATDLDEAALGIARRGRYPESLVTSVPTTLRSNWMQQVGSEWAVVPELRECVVVARHNVAFDPPFPRVHLISLRNTLIYFEPSLQERVLHLCHYALVPGGSIVLGQSERIPHIDVAFTPVDYSNRIYRRGESTRLPSLTVGRYSNPTRVPGSNVAGREAGDDVGTARVPYRRVLQAVAPPTLVLDERDLLIEIIGDVAPWCGVSEGRQTGAVSEVLREPYRVVVRTMLGQLHHGGSTEIHRTVTAENAAVAITVASLPGERATRSVVVFRPLEGPTEASTVITVPDGAGLDITAELDAAQQALEVIVQDLGSSNEELQAMNEELQASSEELQATTEEAQAANEELEATNEELTTLNYELQERTTEALRINTDLVNIQLSLTSGLVIVDRDLKVTRFTPLAVRLFSLIDEDHGRPLTAIPTTIPLEGLREDLEATLGRRTPVMRELRSATADYLLQTQPYLGAGGDVQGVIVVITDVGEVSSARRARDDALRNLNFMTDTIRELVWQRDPDGVLTFVNSRVEDMYGLERAQVLADPSVLLSAVHPDDRDRVATVLAGTHRDWQCQYRIVRPDGTVRWIDEAAHAIATDGSHPHIVIGSAVDVTERHHLEMLAAERTAVLDALLGTVTAGVVVLDTDDRILRVSTGFANLTRYDAAALVGTPLSMLLTRGSDDPRLPTESGGAAPTTGATDNWTVIDSRGTSRSVTIEFQEIDVSSVAGAVSQRIAVVYDISRMREISADLSAREQFDQQTGLLTRQFFRSTTVDIIGTAVQGVAALWIDLDGFKEVNDRFGHRAGDVVLATVATRLRHAARRHDIVGRLGGDEFAILVTRFEDLDGLELLAHRVLAAIREPIVLPESLAYLAASVGIALYPDDGATADELLHNADTAMYAAKNNGRDRHMYFAAVMNQAADERAAIRHQLGEAVRNQDFVLYYQPIVDVRTGEITIAEALVRWNRQGTVVSAFEFIDHATQTGQLRALGKIVLALLDADLTVLQQTFGDDRPRVAVNLSAPELEEREIIDWLLSWAPAGGFDKLVVEVTESVLLDDTGKARDTLAVLHRFGAAISIDDFGTGYSNLELLDRLEPSIIKIDRSLLSRSLDSDRGSNILDAAVRLGHALDAEVVIEGVEDSAGWDRVRDLGVEMAQGYHLDRPMPLADLIAKLSA